MPEESGFDPQLFKELANARSESFKDAKNARNDWFPPDSEKGNDYFCELESVKIGVFKNRDDPNQMDPWLRLQFRIHEDRPDETGGSLMNKKFSGFFVAEGRRLAVASRMIAAMYGSDDCPDDLGSAMLGLEANVGKFYSVAVKESNPGYPKNVFINKCHGAGESAPSA